MHTPQKFWPSIPGLLLTLGSLVQTSPGQQFIAAKNVSPSPNVDGVYATGDINRDGKLDIIAGDQTNNTYVVLLGNGHGTFTEKVPTTPVRLEPSIKLGDVNGDGFLDLVTAYPGPTNNDGLGTGYGKVTLYLGDGTGDFRQTWSANIGASTSFLFLADVNGDRRLDVITGTTATYQGTGNTQVFLNNGNGTFQEKAGSKYSDILAAGDLNGDGKADLVIAGIEILLSNGDGTFRPGPVYTVNDDSFAPVLIGDFNKDGHEDLAVVDGFIGTTSILLGKGDGTFTIKSQFSNGFPGYPGGQSDSQANAATLADLNHDGKLDLVTSSLANFFSPTGAAPSTATASIVSVNLGNGDGTFKGATNYSATADNFGGGPISTGDFNGDGNQDVLIGGTNAGSIFRAPFVQLLPGTRTGALAAPINTLSADPFSTVHADFNHDGIQDIAVVHQGCAGCNTTVSIYLGSGKGYFNAPRTYPIGQTQGALAAGDVNGDGKMDLVVTRATPAYVTPMAKAAAAPASTNDDTSVLLGNGDGTFRPAVNSVLLGPQTGYSTAAWLVDMNRDGKLDLVGDWGVALGKGDGTFRPPKPFPMTLYEIDGVGIGDLNGDGIQDVVVYDTSSGSIETMLGDGTGAYKVKSTFSYPHYFITDLKVAKVYGTKERDIVFCGEAVDAANARLSTNLVATLHGNGDGTFGTKKIMALPNLPLSLSYGDYDRDGKLDVVVDDRLGIEYLRGTGTGSFYAPQLYPGMAHYPQSLDINGDGALDVVGITPIGFERLLNTGKLN